MELSKLSWGIRGTLGRKLLKKSLQYTGVVDFTLGAPDIPTPDGICKAAIRSTGYWAFPGGFLEMNETVARCAERELEEETGIVLTSMQLSGIYSDVERDPRGRVITAAYTAMTTMPEAIAADDAAAAKWWPLNELPPLAFDHDKILADAMRVLKING
ncbi:MAG: NUDIX domain-containing protein [Paludibacteraceae bacterium]|nr:NUDIX domain-containing protein [Paludibacteraceae bacterium]